MTAACGLCGGDHLESACPNMDAVTRARLYADVMLRKPDRRSLLPQPPYKPCGTMGAVLRHRRNGEALCDACRLAERAYKLPMDRARRQQRINEGVGA